MSTLPYLVRLAPGSTPRVEEQFTVAAAETSLSTVWLRLPADGEGDRAVYWSALRETQLFYGRPETPDSDLELAVNSFRSPASGGTRDALVVAVSLGVDGTVYVTGGVGSHEQRDGAVLVPLEPKDDLLSPRSDWQTRAFGTNARASVDAFRRALGERGAHDAVVVSGDRPVRPVVGALVLHVADELHAASATTVVPDLFSALMRSGSITLQDGVVVRDEVQPSDIREAACAWWISPEFEVWSVHELAGRALPRTRELSGFLTLT